jgi:opine dehydrogenase
VLRARQRSLASVKIATLRGKVDIATLPVSENERGLATCIALFGERFVQRADVLAIALSNVNPQRHMALALCNFTHMERGEDWGQTENMTDAVDTTHNRTLGMRIGARREVFPGEARVAMTGELNSAN